MSRRVRDDKRYSIGITNAVQKPCIVIDLPGGGKISIPTGLKVKVNFWDQTSVEFMGETDALSQMSTEKPIEAQSQKITYVENINDNATKISGEIPPFARIPAILLKYFSKLWHEFGWRFFAHLAATMATPFVEMFLRILK